MHKKSAMPGGGLRRTSSNSSQQSTGTNASARSHRTAGTNRSSATGGRSRSSSSNHRPRQTGGSYSHHNHVRGGNGNGQPRMRLELMLHARNLRNLGHLTAVSDPYARVVAMDSSGKNARDILGKTEVIDNNLSPTWTQPIVVDYTPGIKLIIEITIFDKNTKSQDKVMGKAMFDVGEILRAKTQMKAKKLMRSDGTTAGKGWVFVHAESAPDSTAARYLSLKLSGSDLKNVERIGESDPFYEVSKKTADGKDWRVVYRSEHVPNNLNPKWKVAEINLHRLCRGDQTKHLQLAVFDYQKNGKHRPMGEIVTTVDGIIGATGFDSSAKPLALQCDGKGGYGLIHVKRAFFGGDMDDVALSSSRPVSPPRASSRRRVRRLSLIESRPTFSPQSSFGSLTGDDIDASHHTTVTAPPSMTKKDSFSSLKKAPRRSSTNGLKYDGVGFKKDSNHSNHSTPSRPVAPTKESIKPASPKPKQTKANPQPARQPEAPARTHQQILSEARLARQRKQSAREHGFKGVWLLMANAGNLDDEELSAQDEECVQSMDAVMAIGTAIRQVLPKSA